MVPPAVMIASQRARARWSGTPHYPSERLKIAVGRNTHGLDSGVHSATVGQSHDTLRRITGTTVHGVGGPELSRDGQAVLVQIDRDDPPGRVELRSQKRSQADRTGTDDGKAIPG